MTMKFVCKYIYTYIPLSIKHITINPLNPILVWQINFTLFYLNKKKICLRKKFRLPIFLLFTRFEVSWIRFSHFWKTSVCDTHFLVIPALEERHYFNENLYLVAIWHKMAFFLYYALQFNFWEHMYLSLFVINP